MAWYDDPVLVTIVAIVIISAVAVVVFAMRRLDRNEPKKKQKQTTKGQSTASDPLIDYGSVPFKISKSVQANTASSAKDELRMLDLEREILGDALRRLYEAQAEGKITEQEREKLAGTYTSRMMAIKESISKDESIVALHDLESMQEDLMKLFSERFGELTSKVEELRSRIDVKPIREIPVKMPTPASTAQMERIDEGEEDTGTKEDVEERQKRKRKPAEEKPEAKNEAEKKIESIRSEVEKVLDRLGQMEAES